VVLRVDDYEELRSRYGADALEDAIIDLDLKAKLEPSLYPEHKHCAERGYKNPEFERLLRAQQKQSELVPTKEEVSA
jgi:hypothetical protein